MTNQEALQLLTNATGQINAPRQVHVQIMEAVQTLEKALASLTAAERILADPLTRAMSGVEKGPKDDSPKKESPKLLPKG